MIRLVVLLAVLFAALPSVADAAPALRRFALVVSANDGGPGRTRLRFADSDAEGISRVLASLGGVQSEDLVVVRDATRPRVQAAFAQMGGQIAAHRRPGVRNELFVYYSGHSDEQGLLLGRDRIGYKELRGFIEAAGADVRIAVLDSCASGNIVRLKGGTHARPFLSDVSTQATGHAFLTASSENEAAQESDRIGAAFFTHFLVSGLRGAADSNRDKRVTLDEAYRFAYGETLSRTEISRAGAQHPMYDIQLAGTGELVMTDLRASGARLVLPDKLAGRVYVRDAAGRLLAELRKEPLYPVELGLEPGRYRVVLDADGLPAEANVVLIAGQRTELAANAFTPLAPLVAVSRGGAAPDASVAAASAACRDVPADLVLVPGVRASGGDQPTCHKFAFGVITESTSLRGMQLSLVGNIVREDMHGLQLSPGFNMIYGPGRGVQLSSFANISFGEFRGVQLSSSANIGKGAYTGLQLGLFNMAMGNMRGAQVSVVNVGGADAEGAQIAVGNYVRGGIAGAQIGVVNVGGRVRGTQVGVINVASEVDGLQLGVVNVARRNSGVSFGLLPLVLTGYNRVTAWSSDVSLANVGVKLGSDHFYTLIGGGATDRGRSDADDRAYTTSFGIGAHITPWEKVFIDTDAVSTEFWSENGYGNQDRNLATLRVMVGWQVARHFAVTAGPTYNVQTSWNGQDYKPGRGVAEHVIRDGGTTVRMWPGLALGVQL